MLVPFPCKADRNEWVTGVTHPPWLRRETVNAGAVSQSAGTGAIATVKSLMASVKADGLSGGAVTHADTLIQEYEWHTGKAQVRRKGPHQWLRQQAQCSNGTTVDQRLAKSRFLFFSLQIERKLGGW